MSKYILLPEKSGNSINQNVLTDKLNLAYFNCAVAKNSGQVSHPERLRRTSRHLLRGFFNARNKLVHCAIMTDCAGELLASALSSPRSLICGSANPAWSVTFRFAPKVTVSKLIKETTHV